MTTSPSFAYLSYISLTCGIACAQNGQSKAQKSMSTTLPRSCSSFKGAELIHVSPALSSGAFWPTKASSGCCAQTVVATSNTRKIDLRSIAVSVYEEWPTILSQNPGQTSDFETPAQTLLFWSAFCIRATRGKRRTNKSSSPHVPGSWPGAACRESAHQAIQTTGTRL